jgi:hypothetical protein
MENILADVDFQTYDLLNIKVNVKESDMFNDDEKDEVDEYGQSLDVVSVLRRAIKYSHPFDNKKIIKTITPHELKENEDGEECRDIEFEYFLLVEKGEMEEFSIEELRDTLVDEWNGGNSLCTIEIEPYEHKV